MKKFLLSIASLAIIGASTAQTNLDLETWSSGNPTGWITSGLLYAPNTIAQVTGNGSTSAIQITTDSVYGVIPQTTGEVDTTGFAFQLIANAPVFSSLAFDYKTAYIGTTDTGYVSIGFLDNGATYTISFNLQPIPTWYSTPSISLAGAYSQLPPGFATDSVIISVYSSGRTTQVRNNSVTVDNIVLNSSVGVYEVFSGVSVKTYPNPTTDVVNFDIDSDENLTISIFALDGSLVKTVAKTSTLTSVSLNDMDKGSYIYKISKLNGNTVKTGKFIKQ
jgi:hypothetical protein